MHGTYYNKLQPYFGQEYLQCHYIDTDAFLLSLITKIYWKFLKTYLLFDFSNLNENHEIFSRKNKKVIGEIKIETFKNIWIDEFICLRSKHYSFNCKDDIESKKNWKVFLNLNQNFFNLKNRKIVLMEKIIKKYVIIILFDHLIMICIIRK